MAGVRLIQRVSFTKLYIPIAKLYASKYRMIA